MATKRYKRGFGLVEMVIAISIVAGFIVILAGVNTLYLKISYSQSSKIQAAFLAEEGIEVMRYLRDKSWSSNVGAMLPNTDYFITFSGTDWATTTALTYFGIFDRRIQLQAVSRDANDDIVSVGGALDPNTRLITSTVSWPERGATSTKTVSAYITNLFAN